MCQGQESAGRLRIAGIYTEITDHCNFRCVYCYNDSSAHKQHYLSSEDYKRFVERMMIYGLKRVTLSGGEPTLHPDFGRFVEINHNLGLKQHFITNGTRVNDHLCQMLKGIDFTVGLAIDGYDRQTNDSLRGNGSYEITTKALRLFIENGFTEQVSIRCNLSLENVSRIYDIAWDLDRMGVKSIVYALLKNFGRAVQLELIDEIKHRAIIEEADHQISRINQNLSIRASFEHNVQLGCPYENSENEFSFRIDPHGDIYPCQMIMKKEFSLGNIKTLCDTSLHDRVTSFTNLVLSRPKEIAQCRNCAYQSACHGGCAATAIERTGDVMSVDGLCSARKQAIRKAIALGRENAS